VAIFVAVAALVIGITMLQSHHKERLGVIFIVGGVAAAIIALVTRRR
jgi:hypothetical protein